MERLTALMGVTMRFLKPTVGFEPTTTGLQNQSSKNTSIEKAKTCVAHETKLTPQLTPEYPKTGELDTKKLPSDLAEIVAVWPELQEHIKAAIKALVQSSMERN
jgi:hypothetical protein